MCSTTYFVSTFFFFLLVSSESVRLPEFIAEENNVQLTTQLPPFDSSNGMETNEQLDKMEKELIDLALPALNKTIHMAVSIYRSIPKIRIQRDVNHQLRSISSFFNFDLPPQDDQSMTTTTMPSTTTTLDPQSTDSTVNTAAPDE